MKTTIHKAEQRGHADHGWLKANHSFSFAQWYDPSRMHFGALRVLNDDTVAGGMGFGMHPHANMEIVTIPLSGALRHKDSMGHEGVIEAGEIQLMSAGTGIYHSEMNAHDTEEVKLLQIWVMPDKHNVTPRYDQRKLEPKNSKNRFEQIVSPDPQDEGSWIHQQSWFQLGSFDQRQTIDYPLHSSKNGIYLFVIEGSVQVADTVLNRRDAIGISETDFVSMQTVADSRLLLIEVPMHA